MQLSWLHPQAVLSCPDTPMFEFLCDSMRFRIKEFKPQEIANFIWSMAITGYKSPGALSFMLPWVEEIVHEFSCQSTANFVWSYAKLGLDDSKVIRLIESAATRKLHSFSEQDLSTTLWAFGTMLHRNDRFLEDWIEVGFQTSSTWILEASACLQHPVGPGINDLLWCSFLHCSYPWHPKIHEKLRSPGPGLFHLGLCYCGSPRPKLHRSGGWPGGCPTQAVWCTERGQYAVGSGLFEDLSCEVVWCTEPYPGWLHFVLLQWEGACHGHQGIDDWTRKGWGVLGTFPAVAEAWCEPGISALSLYLHRSRHLQPSLWREMQVMSVLARFQPCRYVQQAILNAAALRLAEVGSLSDAVQLLEGLLEVDASNAVAKQLREKLAVGHFRSVTSSSLNVQWKFPSRTLGHTGLDYDKQCRLLEHVLCTAQRGDAWSVVDTIERFSVEGNGWLKIAGGGKGVVLDDLVKKLAPQPAELVLEFGCFVGYSSTRMAYWLRHSGGRLLSVEVDPIHVCIARSLPETFGKARVIFLSLNFFSNTPVVAKAHWQDIYIIIYMVIDLKVLVRSFNCESRACYVGNPRESFFSSSRK